MYNKVKYKVDRETNPITFFFPFFFHPLFFHSTKITYTHLAYTSYESYSQNIFLNNSQVSNYCQKIPQKLHKLYKTVKQY